MSHHYAGPDFGFPKGDARLNLTDVYAFPKPGGAGKSILIVNAHPSSSFVSHEPTRPDPFAADAWYELRIDTNGDAVADIVYRVRFSPGPAVTQTATLYRIEGQQCADVGADGEIILQGAAVSLGGRAIISAAGEYRFFAGWRSEPFFFDPEGAVNNLQFTGHDFFIDKDVCSIVLEVPNAVLGTGKIGIWARILVRDGTGGGWVQADRSGRPSQGVFLVGDQRAAYLAAEPAEDARFIPVFAHSLEHTGGYTPEQARQIAMALLPDVMRFDPARPASYPNNGRTLTDDVLDHFLGILTNGRVTSDGIGPHRDLLDEFPYLGPPHQQRL